MRKIDREGIIRALFEIAHDSNRVHDPKLEYQIALAVSDAHGYEIARTTYENLNNAPDIQRNVRIILRSIAHDLERRANSQDSHVSTSNFGTALSVTVAGGVFLTIVTAGATLPLLAGAVLTSGAGAGCVAYGNSAREEAKENRRLAAALQKWLDEV